MSDSILDLKPISRARRNHGLEHATMHILGRKFPRVTLGGHSDPFGFAISGIFAGLAAWLGTLGAGKETKQKLARLPLMMMLATIALVLAQPLGPIIQKQITTSGDPDALELVRVETNIRAGLKFHRVITEG